MADDQPPKFPTYYSAPHNLLWRFSDVDKPEDLRLCTHCGQLGGDFVNVDYHNDRTPDLHDHIVVKCPEHAAKWLAKGGQRGQR